MKKISILLLFILCLLGCSSEKNISNASYQQLMDNIKTTMPIDVYNELMEKGDVVNKKEQFIISNDKENPTLRLDFTYEKNKLVNYTSKEYGFVDRMKDQCINEEEAKLLAQTFAKTFLKEEVTLQKINNLSDYDGENYVTLEDQNKNIYLVQLDKNMVIQYRSHDQL